MTTKTRTHGFANVAKRSKWCAECSRWVGYSQWPKHQLGHKIPQPLMNQVNKAYTKMSETGTSSPSWADSVSHQPLYEEMYSNKLKRENTQLRRVICEQARVIVETYSEYN